MAQGPGPHLPFSDNKDLGGFLAPPFSCKSVLSPSREFAHFAKRDRWFPSVAAVKMSGLDWALAKWCWVWVQVIR